MISLLFSTLLFWAAPGHAWFWGGPDVSCAAKDREISIDGNDAEWRSVEPEDVEAMSVACFSDDTDLYLYLSPHDRATELQLLGYLGQTFTLWFDPSGAKKHSKSRGVLVSYRPKDIKGQGKPLLTYGPDPLGVADPIDKVELVSDGVAASTPASRVGIELKTGMAAKRLFYELKLPLAAVGLSPAPKKREFRLGLETSAFSDEAAEELRKARQRTAQQPGGGAEGEGGGGPRISMGGGMRHGRGGRRMRGSGLASPEPFEWWPLLRLAEPK
jgi:hypothetical protein